MNEIDFSPYTVQIVDDNDFVREVLRKHLEMFGFTKVFQATDGFDAINQVTEVKPDVIICDINMKPLDGFDFLRHLRRLGRPLRDTPVVFLTSHANKEFIEEAKELKVRGYLLKPVLPQKLYAEIRKCLDIK